MPLLDRPRVFAFLGAACAILFIGLNVAGNYGGNLSGMFYTGSQAKLPPAVAAHTQRVADPVGYDAQYYHLAAHDPWLTRNYAEYADNARLRWRRIAVPAAAHMLGFGHPGLVDAAYIAIEILFVYLGVLWLGLYSRMVKLPAWYGLAFMTIPATLVSLDRMTVDLPLAALVIGIVLYADASRRTLYPLLVLAPLVRETGMILVFGCCVYMVLQRRRWRDVSETAFCAFPALGWWAYVHSRTPPDATSWIARFPFSGLIERTMTIGREFGAGSLWLRVAGALEVLAFVGIWLALLWTATLLWKRQLDLLVVVAGSFFAFVSLLGKPDIWDSAYATGRTMSPLLVVLLLLAFRERRASLLLPTLLIVPRIALQYQAQFKSAIHHIF